jgi:hypothetical protein
MYVFRRFCRAFIPGFAALCALMIASTILAAAPASTSGEPAFDPEKAAIVTRAIDENDDIRAFYAICPAERFNSRANAILRRISGGKIPEEQCVRSPEGCWTLCKDGRNPHACFSLARAFQDHLPNDKQNYAQTLFSIACATGFSAGCVNRAAGIRNGYYSGDPMRVLESTAQNACLFRSFKIGCDKGDAWGCAMLGQSHHYGEGTPRNLKLARANYRQSCKLAPKFVACGFARSAMSEMKRR